MVKEEVSINLLDNKGKSLVDQFLDWALAVGRLLIIITETIALAVFLYRFSIDRQLIDLHDEIKRYQSIVSFDKTSEQKFRRIQQKLTVSRTHTDGSQKNIALFKDLLQLAQGHNVTYSKLNVTNTVLEVSAQSNTPDNLSAYVHALRDIERINALSIDKVENKTASAMVVLTLTAKLEPATPITPMQNQPATNGIQNQ